MRSLLKYLFRGKKNIPPHVILDSFKNQFGHSMNVEWEKIQDEFEAIFYFENIEQIARYNTSGVLISLKKNLTINNLAEKIADVAASFGEVMNVIEIQKGDIKNFEIIYRDPELIRYSVLLDDNGTVLIHSVL